eukprot:g4188.t1
MFASSASSLSNRRTASRAKAAKRAREARQTQLLFDVPRNYRCLRVVGKGAYGIVCEALNKNAKSDAKKRVAIKKIKEALFHPLDAKLVLRELKISRLLGVHPNVLDIEHIVKPHSKRLMDTIYIVSQFMDTDLYRLCQSRVELSNKHLQYLTYQILCGLNFMHSANILHRDMKTANLLVDRHFNLKICDFGLARFARPGERVRDGVDDEEEEEQRGRGDAFLPGGTKGGPPLTELVVTLWYRAPELVANSHYDSSIDLWATGCIIAEMLLRRPIFPGRDHLHQLQLITDVMGTPSESDIRSIGGTYARRVLRSLPHRSPRSLSRIFPRADPGAVDLVQRMLYFDSSKRLTAAEALRHDWLQPMHDEIADMVIEKPLEQEFAFDKLQEPTVTGMRSEIYDEIMKLSSGTGNRFKSVGARELATPSKVLHYGDEAGKSDANRFAESDAHEGQPASRPDGSRGENASSPSAASSALDSALIQSVAAATQSSEELLQNIQLNRMKKRLAAASAALDAVLATDDSTGENEVAPVLLREDVERPVKQGWVKSSSSKSFDKTPSIIDADKSTIRSSGSVSSLRESSKLSPSTRRPSSRLSASFSDNNIRSSAKSSRDALRTSPSTATKENRPNLSRKVAGNFNGEGRPLYMHASRNSHAAPPPPAAKAAPVKITGDVLIRRKKKATVPKPFNFSSRRNKFGTPKHIRAQREAKARRAAREANRLQSGTRRTKYF